MSRSESVAYCARRATFGRIVEMVEHGIGSGGMQR